MGRWATGGIYVCVTDGMSDWNPPNHWKYIRHIQSAGYIVVTCSLPEKKKTFPGCKGVRWAWYHKHTHSWWYLCFLNFPPCASKRSTEPTSSLVSSFAKPQQAADLQRCTPHRLHARRWSTSFFQIKERNREWEMGWGVGGLAEMTWAEHCGCFPLANPCDWWLGSIKSQCWQRCQLLINPSKCLLHLDPKLLLYIQYKYVYVQAHTHGKTVHTTSSICFTVHEYTSLLRGLGNADCCKLNIDGGIIRWQVKDL